MAQVCTRSVKGEGMCPEGVCNNPIFNCHGTKILDYSILVPSTIPPINGSFGKRVTGLSADEVQWPDLSS